MFKQFFSVAAAAAAVFLVSMSDANAKAGMTLAADSSSFGYQPVDCRWDPQGSAICRGRNFCYRSVFHPKCQQYCNYNPYDRICDARDPRGPRGPGGPRWPRR